MVFCPWLPSYALNPKARKNTDLVGMFTVTFQGRPVYHHNPDDDKTTRRLKPKPTLKKAAALSSHDLQKMSGLIQSPTDAHLKRMLKRISGHKKTGKTVDIHFDQEG
jgi:hypothetical protein